MFHFAFCRSMLCSLCFCFCIMHIHVAHAPCASFLMRKSAYGSILRCILDARLPSPQPRTRRLCPCNCNKLLQEYYPSYRYAIQVQMCPQTICTYTPSGDPRIPQAHSYQLRATTLYGAVDTHEHRAGNAGSGRFARASGLGSQEPPPRGDEGSSPSPDCRSSCPSPSSLPS
jgi:hypothetical protein